MRQRKPLAVRPRGRYAGNVYMYKKDNTPFVTRKMWDSGKHHPTRNLSSKYDVLSNSSRIKTIFGIIKSFGFSNKKARLLVDTLGNEHATYLAQCCGQRKAVALVNQLGKERLTHFIEHFGVEGALKLLKKYKLETVNSLSRINKDELDLAIRGCSIFGPQKFFRIYQELGGGFGFSMVLGVGPKFAKRLIGAIGPNVAFRVLSLYKGENKVRRILRESKTNDQIRERISILLQSSRR
jgi:hypothetical protein